MENSEKIVNHDKKWFMVEIIEKCEPVDRDETRDLRRVKSWGNFHLIKAASASEAYDKGVKIGKDGEYIFINSDGIKLEWLFVGIGELLPIYEDIEDGAELMWTDYGFISNRRTQKFARTKEELLDMIEHKDTNIK